MKNQCLVVALAISAMLCLNIPVNAQNCPVCGDANGDGTSNVGDFTYMVNYFFDGGPAPTQCANVDGCGGATIADLLRMDRHYRYGTPAFLDCNSTTPCIALIGGGVKFGCRPFSVYPGGDSMAIPVLVTTVAGVTGLSLGFDYSAYNVLISSIDVSGSQVATDFITAKYDPIGKKVLLVAGLTGQNPPVYTNALLCKLNVQLLGSDSLQLLMPDSTFVAPGGEWLMVTDQLPYYRPAFSQGFCCSLCGDANSDGAIDVSDAIFILSFIFADGPAPYSHNYRYSHGDANGDAKIDISDAVYLVLRIFSGGPEPHCYGQ